MKAQEPPRGATPHPRSGRVAERRHPASEVRGGDERTYSASEVRGGDERSHPASGVRGGSREELPQARGQGRWPGQRWVTGGRTRGREARVLE